MHQPRVSAIVATYNWPEALDLVLDGLTRQTYRNLEIVVADDGSRPDTADLVAARGKTSPVPIVHSWQPDDGYRLARSRNLAVTRATGDYLLMLDGDGLVFPTFVENHVRHAAPGWFTVGRRCYLRRWTRAALFPLMLLGGANRPLQVLSIPQSAARRRNRPTEWNKAQTCNLGVWRADFEAIGGFEEGFVGYGLEDTDFVVRLIRSGVRRITLEHLDPVLHIWHPRRKIAEDNRDKLAQIMVGDRIRAAQSVLLEAA